MAKLTMIVSKGPNLGYIFFLITYSLSDHFSSFQLSSDGSKLLYIAEKKIPESISYFKRNIGMKAGMHNCFFI